jgi:hypothetical protein
LSPRPLERFSEGCRTKIRRTRIQPDLQCSCGLFALAVLGGPALLVSSLRGKGTSLLLPVSALALHFFVLTVASWICRGQQNVIDDLREANRCMREQVAGWRLRLVDEPPRRDWTSPRWLPGPASSRQRYGRDPVFTQAFHGDARDSGRKSHHAALGAKLARTLERTVPPSGVGTGIRRHVQSVWSAVHLAILRVP